MNTYNAKPSELYALDVTKQEAQMIATRETLRALIRESPYTLRSVADRVGEEYTTLSKRLHGNVEGYRQLDTAVVVNILAMLDMPIGDFFTRVEERAQEILRNQG